METSGQSARGDVTGLLRVWSDGEECAFDRLLALVYDDLQRMARRYVARERPDVSLQATDLVNELCLRLLGWNPIRWQNRAQFYGVSAQMMRRVLVDIARRRAAGRRGSGAVHVPIDDVDIAVEPRDADLAAVDDALEQLAVVDTRKARVVELRFFLADCRCRRRPRCSAYPCAPCRTTGRSLAPGSIEPSPRGRRERRPLAGAGADLQRGAATPTRPLGNLRLCGLWQR